MNRANPDKAFEQAKRRIRRTYPQNVANVLIKYLGHDPDIGEPVIINASISVLLDHIDSLTAELAALRAEKGVPLAAGTI